MLQLLQAIQQAFTNNSALDLFPNGLENALAADASTLPNCTVLEVNVDTEYWTPQIGGIQFVETAYLQFTVRSTDGTVVRQALDTIQQQYDHIGLTMSSDILLDARLVGKNNVTREDERVWRGDAEYKFTVGRVLSR